MKNLFGLLTVLCFPTRILSMISLHAVTRNNPKETADASLWTVLVHGLDSSSQTWETTMEELHCPCLAVDQRGCGRSPLGDPKDFSQDALVEDLREVILNHCGEKAKLVLVGHSLGGRVVMGYAAKYPNDIASLIIEDMDISVRDPKANGIIQLQPYEGVFDQRRATRELMIKALVDVGYPESFIEKALDSGRISQTKKGDWWSQVNPDFRKLCYPHVLSTSRGQKDCFTIAKNGDITCHVLVAGNEGTVCNEESVQEMKDILVDKLTIHRFPSAGHSIHSTASDDFLALVNDIIQQAKRNL